MNSDKRNSRMLKISTSFMFAATILTYYLLPGMSDLTIILIVVGYAAGGLILSAVIETFIRD